MHLINSTHIYLEQVSDDQVKKKQQFFSPQKHSIVSVQNIKQQSAVVVATMHLNALGDFSLILKATGSHML